MKTVTQKSARVPPKPKGNGRDAPIPSARTARVGKSPREQLAKKNPGSTSQAMTYPYPLAHFEPHTCRSCQSGGNAWIQSWLEWYQE